jgi:DNA polymerase III subunit beta
MEIQTSREEVVPSLMKVSGIVERRQTLPILGNLLISAGEGGMRLIGTDLEVQVETVFAADVREGGDVTVPARKLMDVCRALPEGAEIVLRAQQDRATLMAGRGRFAFGTLPAKGFPIMDVSAGSERVEMEQGRLKHLIGKTAFAMAHQDVRYYLNGLLFSRRGEEVLAVATDGHRLARASFSLAGDGGGGSDVEIILPRKTVLELGRLLGGTDEPCVLEISERAVRVEIGDTVLTSKLVDGRYPDYERVIPRGGQVRAVADREDLRQALGRTAILSSEKHKGVTLNFEAGMLRCLAHNPEQEEAEEELSVEYEGEKTAIGFNVGYLIDVLNVVDEGEVEIWFIDSNSSAVLRGKGVDEETFVVMPMRL